MQLQKQEEISITIYERQGLYYSSEMTEEEPMLVTLDQYIRQTCANKKFFVNTDSFTILITITHSLTD